MPVVNEIASRARHDVPLSAFSALCPAAAYERLHGPRKKQSVCPGFLPRVSADFGPSPPRPCATDLCPCSRSSSASSLIRCAQLGASSRPPQFGGRTLARCRLPSPLRRRHRPPSGGGIGFSSGASWGSFDKSTSKVDQEGYDVLGLGEADSSMKHGVARISPASCFFTHPGSLAILRDATFPRSWPKVLARARARPKIKR